MDLTKAIEQTMVLQDAANKVMCAKRFPDVASWKDAGIDWYSCALAEMGESFGWTGYKHWKDVAPDWHQTFVEVVDTYHFMLSRAIELGVTAQDLAEEVKRAEPSRKLTLELQYGQDIEGKKDVAKTAIKETMKWILRADSLHDDKGEKECLAYTVAALASCGAAMGFRLEDLFSVYVPKNTLNMFRQHNGDPTGDYPRHWNVQGKTLEDNQVVELLVKANPKLAFDAEALTAELSKKLKEHNDSLPKPRASTPGL